MMAPMLEPPPDLSFEPFPSLSPEGCFACESSVDSPLPLLPLLLLPLLLLLFLLPPLLALSPCCSTGEVGAAKPLELVPPEGTAGVPLALLACVVVVPPGVLPPGVVVVVPPPLSPSSGSGLGLVGSLGSLAGSLTGVVCPL